MQDRRVKNDVVSEDVVEGADILFLKECVPGS